MVGQTKPVFEEVAMMINELLKSLQSPPGWSRTITIVTLVAIAVFIASNWYNKGIIDSLREQISLLKTQVELARTEVVKSQSPSGNAPTQSTISPQPVSIKNENIQINQVPDLRGQLVLVEAENSRLETDIARLNREVASLTPLREELASANVRIKTRGRLLQEAKKWVREDTKQEIEEELK
ncbi:MAG: hypothetical protein C4522_20820 [Desulfobacteraceae bacterium]|nr:MAG: hypothetical protein C4522_20820 [Desulfobacteraceae bacterium]